MSFDRKKRQRWQMQNSSAERDQKSNPNAYEMCEIAASWLHAFFSLCVCGINRETYSKPYENCNSLLWNPMFHSLFFRIFFYNSFFAPIFHIACIMLWNCITFMFICYGNANKNLKKILRPKSTGDLRCFWWKKEKRKKRWRMNGVNRMQWRV